MAVGHPYRARPKASTHDWLTPRRLFEPLGKFDLDPCASPSQPWVTAEKHYAPPDDGLALPWFGRVWMNPPYGSQTSAWLEKLAEHGNGIALVFARTDTRMFVRSVWSKADAVLFLAGRPKFCRPDGTTARGNSGGPMCMIAFGIENVSALRKSKLPGALVFPMDLHE